jgi:hypothetical protein
MKKQIHIQKGLLILTAIFICSLFLVMFVYRITHEKVDTSYMWNIKLTNLKVKEGSEKYRLVASFKNGMFATLRLGDNHE